MKKIKIYIAGAITGHDLQERRETFMKWQKYFEDRGYAVVNPMELPHNHDKTWESYMKECIVALVDCTTIFLIDGWEESKGAQLELHIAKKLDFIIIRSDKKI
jgi:hypothetical protein